MIDRTLAGIVLAACIVALIRLMLGERRRARFDAALRGFVRKMREFAASLRNRRAAVRAADEVIERARNRGEWDGNVYKPKSFRKPPRDKMH